MKTAARIPVLIRFDGAAARSDGWGHLDELSAIGGRLETQSELKENELIEVSFQVAGEKCDAWPARVRRAEWDRDGFWQAEVRFTDETRKRRLAKVLLDALSR
jgi:hypothetical protein